MRLFILVVTLLVPTFASSAEKITPGRYQLTSYTTGMSWTSLVLVDTATGKTWVSVLDENMQWKPVPIGKTTNTTAPLSDVDSGQSGE